MRYPRERAVSAEFLRLVLKRMVDHPAAFTPFSYSIWYEHLAGLNPALSEALNTLLESDAKLDDDSVEMLYAQYISDYDINVQNELHEDVRQLLLNLAGFVAEADKQALSFGDSLQTYSDALKGKLSAKELDSLVKSMARDTDRMCSSTQQLHAQLDASRQEVELLHRELESARGESMIDPLTGVFNRRGFESKTNSFFSDPDSDNSSFCLLMLDIDHFKKVNDTYGHPFGDKVICAIASALKSKVKGQDVIARLGGEEFAALLPETNVTGAFVIAEKIRQTIEHGKIRRLDNSGQVGGITISIGIASYTKGCTIAKLIEQADKALYLSKQNGRNQTIVFVQGGNNHVNNRGHNNHESRNQSTV